MSAYVIEPKFPYNQYRRGLVCFDVSIGRYTCNFTDPINLGIKSRLHISYARYLLSVYLGRLLRSDEHVDHINNIPTDDRIENLQILDPVQNALKAAALKSRRMVVVVCPICYLAFERPHNQSPLTSSRYGSICYCSKRCLGKSLRITISDSDKTIIVLNQILCVIDVFPNGNV